jgi:iron complex outermembrane receptor protein
LLYRHDNVLLTAAMTRSLLRGGSDLMRIAVVASCVSLVLAGASFAGGAIAATERVQTRIPPEALGPALETLAQTRDMQVLYFSTTVEGMRTAGATGALTADEALTRLLTGTGLTYRYVDHNAVTILPVSLAGSSSVAPPAASTRTAAAADQDGKEGKSASSRGFRLARMAASQDTGTASVSSATRRSDSQGPSAGQGQVADTESPAVLQTVEVTGSLIRQPSLSGDAALQTVNSREIQLEGAVSVDSLLKNLPQVSTISSTANSSARGIATVNLRNLGPSRTLVLIDGKRVVPGDPTGGAGTEVNLNFIPSALIDHVDVLTGGASATYGSDAIAGVVNFIMKKNFEGFEVDGQWGESGSGDGANYTTNLIWGSNFADGAGNVTLYAEYTSFDAVSQAARSFSATQLGLNAAKTGLVAAGSGNIIEGQIVSFDQPQSSPYRDVMLDPGGTRALVPYDGRQFNYNPYNYLQRPDKRYNLGGFAHREFNANADVYGSAMFLQDRIANQFAPGGTFLDEFLINCGNPLLSAQEQGVLCPDAGQTQADVLSGKRTTEFGNRLNEIDNTSFRIVFGIRGAIAPGWSYDASVQRSEASEAQSTAGNLSNMRVSQALQVTSGANGSPVCIDPSGGCVPLDLFQLGALTPAQEKFVAVTSLDEGETVQQVATASVNGDLGQFRARSPFARRGAQFAAGVAYRRETLDFQPDTEESSGDVVGSAAVVPVSGQFNVRSYFGELQLPLIEDRPFAKLLQADTAYRLSDYDIAQRSADLFAHTYKFGVRYAPVEDVTLRGSWSRAARAPDLNELFFPSALGLFVGNDPCAGANPAATLQQCEHSGVTAAQYGAIPQCVNSSCNSLLGGNPQLKEEDAITRQIGLVLTPRFLPGFAGTIDFYEISLSGAIGTIPALTELTDCVQSGLFCGTVHRGAHGQLFGSNDAFVEATNINTGLLEQHGVDFALNYGRSLSDLGLGDNGRISLHFTGTWLLSYQSKATPTSAALECAGRFGTNCSNIGADTLTVGSPNPRWRHQARLTWEDPMGVLPGFAASLQWRYIGSSSADNSVALPASALQSIGRIPVKQYTDLTLTYQLPLNAQDIGLRLGVNNLSNEQPPVIARQLLGGVGQSSTGNTFPNVYDTLGRVIFLGFDANFR